ncbi:MAG: hypothetical protein RLZZ324_257, partial [Candidatus Parcubacteria bacterium]
MPIRLALAMFLAALVTAVAIPARADWRTHRYQQQLNAALRLPPRRMSHPYLDIVMAPQLQAHDPAAINGIGPPVRTASGTMRRVSMSDFMLFTLKFSNEGESHF